MSKLINKTRLTKFANDFWTKIKERYDDAFVGATLTAAEKKIKFTKKKGGATVDVDLTDYARLQDKNNFKQDVTVDNAKVVSNVNVGEINGPVTAGRRTTGYRGLTSRLFTDGYVKLLRVHLPQAASGNVNAHVWAIKKGASKTEDKYIRKIVKTATVQTAGTNKYIDIDIDSTFADETFFVLRTEGTQIQGIHNIKQEFINDIINVNDSFNPQSTTENINWNSFSPNTDLVGYMELHGRTGIVDINKRIDAIEDTSGTYVKHSETTSAGGNGQAGKVVKLDGQGKLSESMLPAIAINEFISVSAAAWEEGALNGKEYQNGDVIFHEATQKRYLCVDKTKPFANGRFVELNSKDGVVQSVNGKVGAITLGLEATDNKVKLNIGNGTDTTETAIDIISDTEITDILSRLN